MVRRSDEEGVTKPIWGERRAIDDALAVRYPLTTVYRGGMASSNEDPDLRRSHEAPLDDGAGRAEEPAESSSAPFAAASEAGVAAEAPPPSSSSSSSSSAPFVFGDGSSFGAPLSPAASVFLAGRKSQLEPSPTAAGRCVGRCSLPERKIYVCTLPPLE